ncbi:hypothetical protein Q8F55_005941 [Vanrija albida]|uniref:Uncharacterized protein n=1 Tax=Vanrija albida TaxID=181172 RepID=A0ABR3Q322_9TREE
MPPHLPCWYTFRLPRLASVDKRYDEESRAGRPPDPPSPRGRSGSPELLNGHQNIIVIFPDEPLFRRRKTQDSGTYLEVVAIIWEQIVAWSAKLLTCGCTVTFVNIGRPIWRDIVDRWTGDITNPCSPSEDAQFLLDRYWFDFELSQRRVLEEKTRKRLRFLSTEE